MVLLRGGLVSFWQALTWVACCRLAWAAPEGEIAPLGTATQPQETAGNLAGEPQTPATEWLSFGHDSGHTGFVPASLQQLPVQPTWSFKPGEARWSYRKGISVWSSPVVANICGAPRVYIGCYDFRLYCLEGISGRKLWDFTAGEGIFSTPVVVDLEGGPAVIFGSADRTLYALSASDGRKLWSLETFPWKDTVSPCRMSSPVAHQFDNKPVVFIGISNNDRSTFRNIQIGELLALDAGSGKVIWRKRLTSTFVTSPAVGQVGSKLRLFAACQDGLVHALDAATGETFWRFRANELIHGSVTWGVVKGRPLVFFGTRHNSVYALEAETGKTVWRYKCGYWVDSTPALAEVADEPRVFFGSYDRGFYALAAATGEERWKISTGNWISSSPAVAAAIGGRPAAWITSLDGHLYGVDAVSGKKLYEYDGGPFLWSHVQQGDALWESPALAQFGRTSLLVFPSYSYQIHGFVMAVKP